MLLSPRPFRFSVSVRSAGSAEEWKAKARRAEALGFDVFAAADHLVEFFPPMVAIGWAAEATSTLHFGTLVLNNDFRHPAVVAREAATLQMLTGGRFELGIGAGHMEREYREIGLAFDSARARVSRLEEAVPILKGLLAGKVMNFEGEHYTLAGHRSFPLVEPPVPLLIGGNGRRVLELAGREADIVSFVGFTHGDDQVVRGTHFTAAGLANRISIVREAAGERADAMEYNVLLQAVIRTTDRAATAATIATQIPGVSAEELMTSPFVLFGTDAEMADALVDVRARTGVSYLSVFEPAMETLAPAIEQLKGL